MARGTTGTLNLLLNNVFILNNKHSIVAESRRYGVGYSIKTSGTRPCFGQPFFSFNERQNES